MPKYEVQLKDIEIYRVEVDADSEDDAIDKAWEAIESEEGKMNYHEDSDGVSVAFKI